MYDGGCKIAHVSKITKMDGVSFLVLKKSAMLKDI